MRMGAYEGTKLAQLRVGDLWRSALYERQWASDMCLEGDLNCSTLQIFKYVAVAFVQWFLINNVSLIRKGW